MIETAPRVIEFLRSLDQRTYLHVKFAIMPSAEWFRVLRTLPDSELTVARVKHLPDAVLEHLSESPDPEVPLFPARFRPG